MTNATNPIAEAAAALQRLNSSLLSDRPDNVADILDSLAGPDGPLVPLCEFLSDVAGWISTLDGDDAVEAYSEAAGAADSLDTIIDALQNAATHLRAVAD